ncbi:hypothetical protein TGGT1_366730 [Toxoplasma gondii GT1]|uniref:Uncharacterized protein n=2 Tax=Toxoplasma gondii TaxID=5811 RepID=S7UQB9_TOXGG|nr:hypothetical protein TGGT1_366730 [Toxoplasma gondii GT1]KFH12084.1 hypothetical protein TGMAS_366730 [Toxoplasma gondii MAS]
MTPGPHPQRQTHKRKQTHFSPTGKAIANPFYAACQSTSSTLHALDCQEAGDKSLKFTLVPRCVFPLRHSHMSSLYHKVFHLSRVPDPPGALLPDPCSSYA